MPVDLLKVPLPAGVAETEGIGPDDTAVAPIDMSAIGIMDSPATSEVTLDDEDDPLAGLSPTQAALEISELAGLSLDDDEGGES